MHAGVGPLLLSISSEMSELLLNCTNVKEQACPGVGTEVPESLKWARLDIPTTQEWGVLGYLRSSCYILVVLSSLVATLVVLHFGGNLFFYSTSLAPTCLSTVLGPTGSKIPIPSIYYIPLQQEQLEACRFQRHYSQHVRPQLRLVLGAYALILLSI